jgi:hypothetical protein
MPTFVGYATLAIGSGLVAAPRILTRPLGLAGQDTAVRLIGASDLVLVPGLLRAEPRWPWMVARAALNLGIAAYLLGVAPSSSSPAAARGGAAALAALTVIDGATGLRLRRDEV